MQQLKGSGALWFTYRGVNSREGQNLFANHVEVESVGRKGLKVAVGVTTDLTEGTGWIMVERKRVRRPGRAHSCIVISLTSVSSSL